MGLLNTASDGLPSVLFALVRALRFFGPMSKSDLLAVCCPPTLDAHAATASESGHGGRTLKRWTQLGLFLEGQDSRLTLHPDVDGLPRDGVAEVRGLGPLLRRLVLAPSNNLHLNRDEPELAADLTLALCWALAQDAYALPGGAYKYIEPLEGRQFGTSSPYAFRNDTRWNGFRAWVPLLGFGWTEISKGKIKLVVDPSVAVREALPQVFGDASALPIDEFVERLANVLPVMDEGTYRTQVESRLDTQTWRAPQGHELSLTLSMALLRLDAAESLKLDSRADASKRALVGRGYRKLGEYSHVERTDSNHA